MLVFLFVFLFLFILSLTSFIFPPNNSVASISNSQPLLENKGTNTDTEKSPNEILEETTSFSSEDEESLIEETTSFSSEDEESLIEESLIEETEDIFDEVKLASIEIGNIEECSEISKSISREIRNGIINSATVDIAKLCHALRFFNIEKVSFNFAFSTEKITANFPYEKFPYISNKFEKEIKYLIQKLENNDYLYNKLSSIEIATIKSLKEEIEKTEQTFSINLRGIISNFEECLVRKITSVFSNDLFLRQYLNKKICSNYTHIYNEDYEIHIVDKNTVVNFIHSLLLDFNLHDTLSITIFEKFSTIRNDYKDDPVITSVLERFSTMCNDYKDDPVIKSILDYCSHDTQNKENNPIIKFIFEKISDERWKSYERIKKSIEEEIIFSNKETRDFDCYDCKTGSQFFKRYDNQHTNCLVVPQILRTIDRQFSSLFFNHILAEHPPEILSLSLRAILSNKKNNFFQRTSIVLSILQDGFTQNFIDGIENMSHKKENDNKCNNHQLKIAGKILQLFFITTRQLENYLIEKHDLTIEPILNNLSYQFMEDFRNKTVRVSSYIRIRKQIIKLQKIDIKGLHNNGMLYIFELVEFCLYKSHISQTKKLKMQTKTKKEIKEMNFIGRFVERNNRPITRPSTTEIYDENFLSIIDDKNNLHPMDPQLIVFEIKYLPLHSDKYEYKDKKQAIKEVVKVLSELKEKSLQFRV